MRPHAGARRRPAAAGRPSDRPGRLRRLDHRRPRRPPAHHRWPICPRPTQRRRWTTARTWCRAPPTPGPRRPPGFRSSSSPTGLHNPRKIVTAPNGDLFVAESGAGPHPRPARPRPRRPCRVQNTVFASRSAPAVRHRLLPARARTRSMSTSATPTPSCASRTITATLNARGPPRPSCRTSPAAGGCAAAGTGRATSSSRRTTKRCSSRSARTPTSTTWTTTRWKFHRADILEYNPDGTGLRIYAVGHPQPRRHRDRPADRARSGPPSTSGTAWATTWSPDYITHVTDGGFYGWPWYYIGGHQDPRHKGEHPELAGHDHRAGRPAPIALGLARHDLLRRPAVPARRYRGQIFAAEHGSWNRDAPHRLQSHHASRSRNGKATGEYDDFLTGFVTPDGDVWGRPVGVAVGNDGSLFVTDDGSNSVWRVHYVGSAAR